MRPVAVDALGVAVHVQHAVPAPGAPRVPVAIGIADPLPVRIEIAHASAITVPP
jgi:hypothetical protein